MSVSAPLVSAQAVQPAAQAESSVYVEPELLERLQSRSTSSMLVFFSERPDLTPAFSMDWQTRGHFVHERLSETAERAQKDLVSYLNSEGIKHKAFWIDNVVHIEQGDLALLNVLTNQRRFSGIHKVLGEQEVELIEPESMEPSAAILKSTLSAIDNIEHVKAPAVWELGFTGRGIVVGAIDTGVRHTHAALVSNYRGTTGLGQYSHAYNWWDPYTNAAVPFDTHSHGSHVTGTMAGDGGEDYRIGMAPDAKWIHCQGFNPGGTSSKIFECGQFMAAPWDLNGQNPDPGQRPHVVNNSWGDCARSTNAWYDGVIDAWIAAGIVPVFANGNASNCEYPRPPGLNTVGNPARSGKVISVGSTGLNNGMYASHSTWGPTDEPALGLPTYPDHGGFPQIKPNIVAPGVSILSAGREGDQSYYVSNGTSMSTPHVAGLVALMWEAAPCLIGDHATTGTLLMQAANPIPYATGGTPAVGPGNVPNYATGWGEIDALAAVNAAIQHCGGFTISATPSSVRMCAASDAEYQLAIRQHGDFSDAVALSIATGLPGTLTAAFTPSSVVPTAPGAPATLTITAPAGHPDGSYVLEVKAESSGPGHDPESKFRLIGLRVDASALAVANLTSPAPGAVDVGIRPDFTWSGVAGERYQLQVSRDAGFADLVIDETVNATSWRVVYALQTGTTYHWRVRGHNGCGDSAWSAVATFQTRADPTAQVTPAVLDFLFTEEENRAQTLTVANVGTADLVWNIDEANLANGDAAIAADADWSLLGPLGGDVQAVGILPTDPDVMFAGIVPGSPALGKLYRSTDGGANWSVSFTNNGVYEVDFASDGTVYLATHGGIRKSTNGGDTWQALGTHQNTVSVKVAPSNPAVIYAGLGEVVATPARGLIRSTNAGTSWQSITPPVTTASTAWAVAVHPTDPNTVIAGFGPAAGGGSVWVSTDGGNTWANRSAGLPNMSVRALHYDGNRLLVGGGQPFGEQFFGLHESYDLGQTWSEFQITSTPPMVQSIAVDPQNPDIIVVGADQGGVHRTTDGGATWDIAVGDTLGLSVRSVAFVPGYSNRVVAGALSHGVMASEDTGTTFTPRNYGISETSLYSIASNPLNPNEIAVAFQATNSGGVYSSLDNGGTWKLEAAPGTRFITMKFGHDGTLYGISSGPTSIDKEALWRRESDGSWVHLGPSQGAAHLFTTDLTVLEFGRHNPDLIMMGGKDNGTAFGTEATIWRSTDRGNTWTKVFEAGSNSLVASLEIINDGTDLNMVAAWGDFNTGQVVRSTDGGITWSNASSGLPNTLPYRNARICSHRTAPDQVYLSLSNAGATNLFRSQDAGQTWAATGWTINGMTTALACDPMDPAVLYTGSSTPALGPIRRSTDYGASFQPYAAGLPSPLQARSLHFRGDSELLMATASGAYATSLGGEARACRSPNDIPWLSVSPANGTTTPGNSDAVSISVDSTGLDLGQYRAQLCFNSNDPNNELIRVPVQVTVADAQFGDLGGVITASSQCGLDVAPAANVTVSVIGQFNTFTLTTDANGRFDTSIDISESPLTVRVQRAGYLDVEQTGILLSPAGTVQVNLTQPLDAPCATATPAALALEAVAGEQGSTTLRIGNTDGAGVLNWTLEEAVPTAHQGGNPSVASGSPAGNAVLDPASLFALNLPAGSSASTIFGTLNCSGPGVLVNDDGGPEGAYSATPDVVQLLTMVDYFEPDNYPTRLDAVCLMLMTQQFPTLDFDIVVYDDDGYLGGPGTELGVLSRSANNLPVVPPLPNPLIWYAYDISALNIRIQSGGVYVGLRWAPTIPNVMIGADTSDTRPVNQGGGYRKHDGGPWRAIIDSTLDYRALMIRAATTDVSGCDATSNVDWLSLSSGSGSIAGGGFADVTVTVNSENLSVGRHEASLCLNSNDPTRGYIVVPVSFEVTADPADPATVSVLSGSGQSTTVNTAFGSSLAVLVRNGLGQAAAGVTVDFVAPTTGASAVLSATQVTTDSNGYAAVTASANAEVGSYVVEASVAGVSPASFTLENTAAGVDLGISITSLRPVALPGQLVDYLVTVSNHSQGTASDVSVEANVSAELDEALASWQCLGASSTLCTSAGTGNLVDSGLAVQNGVGLSYLFSAPVQPDATGEAVLAGTVTHPLDALLDNNADEARVRIHLEEIFKDGFESEQGLLKRLDADLNARQRVGFILGKAGATKLDIVLLATSVDADGRQQAGFAVQRVTHGGQSWLRIVGFDDLGQEYASHWKAASNQQVWHIDLIQTQAEAGADALHSVRLQVGAEELRLPLLVSPSQYSLWGGNVSITSAEAN